jgi:hypothetical protein
MPWLRLTRQDSEAERALHRGVAAQVPFLLAPDLSEADWAFRRLWDLRPATDFATALGGTQLVDLARRLGRVLVSRDPSLLDDERYPPGNSPGIIVVGKTWEKHLDEFLVTIAGLLGPIVALYRHVKVHGEDSGNLTITSPEGRHRRVTRRFLVDAEGLPLLSGLSEAGQSMGATR